MIVSFYIGGIIIGIIDNFLIKYVKSNDIKGVKLTLSLYDALNNFKKFFSKTMSFKKTGSFDINNNQALGYAVKGLDYDVMELLINAGANVNLIGSDGIRSVILNPMRIRKEWKSQETG